MTSDLTKWKLSRFYVKIEPVSLWWFIKCIIRGDLSEGNVTEPSCLFKYCGICEVMYSGSFENSLHDKSSHWIGSAACRHHSKSTLLRSGQSLWLLSAYKLHWSIYLPDRQHFVQLLRRCCWKVVSECSHDHLCPHILEPLLVFDCKVKKFKWSFPSAGVFIIRTDIFWTSCALLSLFHKNKDRQRLTYPDTAASTWQSA